MQAITFYPVTLTSAIINHGVSDNGDEAIAKKSACPHLKVNSK
jgi:hypothetical protein